MARLAKDVVAKREQFVLDQYNKNPELTAAAANEALVKSLGGPKMRPPRLYELQKIAKAGGKLPETKAEEKTTAARTGAKRGPGRPKKNVTQAARVPSVEAASAPNSESNALLLSGSKEDIQTVIRMLDLMKETGARLSVRNAAFNA